MIQKQKFYHVTSLIVFVGAAFLFYTLGGGTKTEVVEVQSDGYNTNIPDIGSNVKIGDTKLENVQISNAIDGRNAQRSRMANSSFEWFNNDAQQNEITPSASVEQRLTTEEQLMKSLEEGDKLIASFEDKGKNRIDSKSETRQSSANQRRVAFEKRKRERLKVLEDKQDSLLSLGKSTEKTSTQQVESEKIEDAKVETTKKQSGFYSIEGNEKVKSNNIRAVVHGEHKNLQKGSIVKLRLLDNVVIGEHKIPRNTFVYAKLSFGSGRAQLTIDNINMDHFIIPFKGVIYDKDGFQGIYVPDNIVDDTKREVGSDAIKNVKLGNVLGGGLIGSAVDAIQNAASGSIKEEKISISTNYLVTIKQETKTK